MAGEWEDAPSAPAAKGGWEDAPSPVAQNTATFSVPSRPTQFTTPPEQAARMVKTQTGTRRVPVEQPLDRGIYQAGGVATDVLSGLGLPPEAAAAGGYATNLAGQVASTFLGGRAGAQAAPALESGARKVMTMAMKPTVSELEKGVGAKAVNTMLEKGYNVSAGGVDKMNRDIDVLNTVIKEAIAKSPETVNKFKVATYAQQSLDRFRMQVNNASDTKAIKDAVQEFLNDPNIATNIPVDVAQRLKQGTYRALGEKAYRGESKAASEAAQKDLARGLKEEIAAKVPEVGPANKAESELIRARDIAERRVLQHSRLNPVSFGWLSHTPLNALGYMAERNPMVSSAAARALYSGREALPRTAGQVLGAGVGAYEGSPSRLEQELGR